MGNKMKEVAEILGVKLGEPFNLKERDMFNPYTLTDKGLTNGRKDVVGHILTWLLRGRLTIEKIPFKPSDGEIYYFVNHNGAILESMWLSSMIDYANYNVNNCFRTCEEITDEDIKRITEKIRGKYDGIN